MEGRQGLDEARRKEREDLCQRLADVVNKEEIMWRQRGKVLWAREGDGNTKFFHRMASGRRKRNFIEKLEVEGAGVVENEGEIEVEILNFFKNLYKSNVQAGWRVEGLNWRSISSEEAIWIERPFEEEEVRRAVFNCGRDKSPGPDGFSLLLFQSGWETIKKDLMMVMAEFFSSGIVNAITNETFICLIPKKADSIKVTDFRPISLVTSLYKVMSKVLASRLREVLGGTISASQSAFVRERQILDAALVANEVIEDCRRHNRKGMALKIDFEKAYDHVEWNFLDWVMERKGFGERWRLWMRGCLQTANFSVMINGRPRGKFAASRGLRQGDPLSPFLFTLVVDVLSSLIQKAQVLDHFHGLVVGHERVAVTHLQFADDTVFFLGDQNEEWHTLVELLELFCMISGMKINKPKCAITGINLEHDLLVSRAGEWGCEVGGLPTLYLGLPLGGNPRSIPFWDPVVEKVENRLQKWKRACLSRGGRLTMVQTVLRSMPIYYMSLFKAPKGVVGRVEKLMRDFLWEGVEDGKRCHLVNWEVVGKPTKWGGLGVGSLREMNLALLSKWLWRFHLEPNSLWHRIIRSLYGVSNNNWDAKPPTRPSSRSPWKDISWGLDKFLEGCVYVVGDGTRVRFWEDDWNRGGVLKEVFPRLFSLSLKQNHTVSSFTDSHANSLSWDFGFRRNLNEAEIEEVVILLDFLQGVTLVPSRMDKRVWKFDPSGSFSVQSFRRLGGRDENGEVFPPFSQIWKAKSPPKVKVFTWLVALGKINTCDVIQRARPNMCLGPNWCVLCKREGESVDHIFIHCPFTLQLWWKVLGEGLTVWVIPKDCFQLLSINLDAFGKGRKARILWGCLLQAVLWSVWLERNKRIFEDYKGVGVAEMWERIRFWAAIWASATDVFRNCHYSSIMRDMRAALV